MSLDRMHVSILCSEVYKNRFVKIRIIPRVWPVYEGNQ